MQFVKVKERTGWQGKKPCMGFIISHEGEVSFAFNEAFRKIMPPTFDLFINVDEDPFGNIWLIAVDYSDDGNIKSYEKNIVNDKRLIRAFKKGRCFGTYLCESQDVLMDVLKGKHVIFNLKDAYYVEKI